MARLSVYVFVVLVSWGLTSTTELPAACYHAATEERPNGGALRPAKIIK